MKDRTAKVSSSLFATFLLFGLFTSPLSARSLDPDQKERITQMVEAQKQATGAPGLALVIRQGGEVVYSKGFGVDGFGRPFTPQTPSWIGSLSKSFTALAVMQLVAEGKVDLEAPVNTYLPEFKTQDMRSCRITVRNLMEHRSGLTDSNLPDWGRPWPETYANATRRTAKVKSLSSNPGTQIAYHNANYFLLADLVERISGEEFGQYLKHHVFEPLGMKSALVAKHMDEAGQIPPGHVFVIGHPFALRPAGMFVGGAGGVIASAEDLSRWIEAFAQERYHTAGNAILPADMMNEILKPHPDESYVYGYGWVLKQKGTDLICHNGGLPTFVAHAAFARDDSVSIAFVSNASLANVIWSEVGEDISDGVMTILGGKQPAPPSSSRVSVWVDGCAIIITLLFLGASPWLLRARWFRSRFEIAKGYHSILVWIRALLLPGFFLAFVLFVGPWLFSYVESWSWLWIWYLSPVFTTCVWILSALAAGFIVLRSRALLRPQEKNCTLGQNLNYSEYRP